MEPGVEARAVRRGRNTKDARHLLLAAVLAAGASLLAPPGSAHAEGAMPGKAHVRLVDLSSDTQPSDFYIDGTRAWSNVAFKSVSNYIDVKPGPHVYEVRRAGSPADSAPAARVQDEARAESFYSVLSAGMATALKLSVFEDGSPSMPQPDYCQARFINAASGLAAIDFAVRGLDTDFRKLAFLHASRYGELPKGVYDVEMRDSHNQNVIATVKNFLAPGGHMHTLVAAGGQGQPVELVEFYDAMTADSVPQGAAHTGMGAPVSPSTPAAWLPILPLALAGSALFLAGLSRLKP